MNVKIKRLVIFKKTLSHLNMPIAVLTCLCVRMLAFHVYTGSIYAAKHGDKVRPEVERMAWAMCESGQVGQVIATAMTLLRASLRFALRASFQLFKIAPGDFVVPERRLRTQILHQLPRF